MFLYNTELGRAVTDGLKHFISCMFCLIQFFNQCPMSDCCMLNKIVITKKNRCDWCYIVYAEQKYLSSVPYVKPRTKKPSNKSQWDAFRWLWSCFVTKKSFDKLHGQNVHFPQVLWVFIEKVGWCSHVLLLVASSKWNTDWDRLVTEALKNFLLGDKSPGQSAGIIYKLSHLPHEKHGFSDLPVCVWDNGGSQTWVQGQNAFILGFLELKISY